MFVLLSLPKDNKGEWSIVSSPQSRRKLDIVFALVRSKVSYFHQDRGDSSWQVTFTRSVSVCFLQDIFALAHCFEFAGLLSWTMDIQ